MDKREILGFNTNPRNFLDGYVDATLINKNKELKEAKFYVCNAPLEIQYLEDYINNDLWLKDKGDWIVFTINHINMNIEYD